MFGFGRDIIVIIIIKNKFSQIDYEFTQIANSALRLDRINEASLLDIFIRNLSETYPKLLKHIMPIFPFAFCYNNTLFYQFIKII